LSTYGNFYLTGKVSARTLGINQNTVALYFISDESYTESGFSISWTASKGGSGTCLTSIGFGNVAKTCGNDQTGTSGIIQSPNYPNLYNGSCACYWNIKAPSGTFITLNITSLFLQDQKAFFFILFPQNCSRVFNKTLPGYYSSYIITVPQNTVSLAFTTLIDNVGSGFYISWTSSASLSCANVVNGLYLSSAGFPLQVGAHAQSSSLIV
jgi:hypothetical protein